MNIRKTNRRRFLAGTGAALGAMMAAPARRGSAAAPAQEAGGKAIRLGGPVYARFEDPEELARAHVALGYRAAYCPNVPLDDSARLSAVAAAFRKHEVVLAEVGRWVNLLDARAEARRANLQKVTDGLALAEAVGALCCVDIAGSYSTTQWYGPHPDNLSNRFFDAAVENARAIIDAVKPKRAKFCYEMSGWAIPDSPDSNIKLIKAVDREAFGVHLDPCNLINSPARFYRNTDLLNECFDKLARWIVSCHAKDLTWDVEMNVHFREVRPGTGSLDYRTFLDRLSQLPRKPPLMLEHLPNEKEYDLARQYILDQGKAQGIRIG